MIEHMLREQHVVAVGASAGGVEALTRLCSLLPEDLPAAVFVVLHVSSTFPSFLPQILSRAGHLPAQHARDGQPIQAGKIYIAPPDMHLMVGERTMYLSRGPQENGHRPAIDVLFRSAAEAYRSNVIGVVLSGTLRDGALGLRDIQKAGGVTIVQDPQEALYPGMPENALRTLVVDFTLPVAGIASRIIELVQARTPANSGKRPEESQSNTEVKLPTPLVRDQAQFEQNMDNFNINRTLVTCPDCGGVLWEREEEGVTSYVCQTGHRYSADSLLEGQAREVEAAMWAALRALEERASLTSRLADRAGEQGNQHSQRHFSNTAEEARENAHLIRLALGIGKQNAPTLEPGFERKNETTSRQASRPLPD
jgi:two-component system, chemotaxis family, protein-glutamate methylesterase/glutaminase